MDPVTTTAAVTTVVHAFPHRPFLHADGGQAVMIAPAAGLICTGQSSTRSFCWVKAQTGV